MNHLSDRPRLRLDRLPSPIGDITVVVDERDSLRAVEFAGHEDRLPRSLRLRHGAVEIAEGAAPIAVRQAFARYFAGELNALASLAWSLSGTPFQRKVWLALTAIPPGETSSYGALAARIGMPTAVRAVGLANGANPTPLVVPCHRVIGADGSLTGFGGGLDRKRWLLRHEGACFIDRAAA